jgi:hypothetical protein
VVQMGERRNLPLVHSELGLHLLGVNMPFKAVSHHYELLD